MNQWTMRDAHGNWLGIAVGETEAEAFQYAIKVLGINKVDRLEPREEEVSEEIGQ